MTNVFSASNFNCWRAGIFVLVLLFRLFLNAAETSTAYTSRLWQTEDGLPHNSIQAIAQTSDGYLWVGTRDGLARFDGMRFKTFDPQNTPELKARPITALCEDLNGSLWIGTEGGGLSQFSSGQFSYDDKNSKASGDIVRALLQTRDGTMWIGTTNGLSKWQNGKLEVLTNNSGHALSFVRSLCEDNNGNLWIGTGLGLYCRKTNGVLSVYRTQHGLPHNSIRTVCEDERGHLWLGQDNGLVRFANGKFTHFTKHSGLADNLISVLYRSRNGVVWAGTYGGLNRMHFQTNALVHLRNAQTLLPTNPPPQVSFTFELNRDGESFDRVQCMFEDRESNLWIGTRDGLHCLTRRRFRSYTKKEGLTHSATVSVLEDKDGSIWMGLYSGGLNQLKDGKITAYTAAHGLSSDMILALHEDRKGSLWIGTDFNGGLNRWKDAQFQQFGTVSKKLRDPAIHVIHQDREGGIWLGTRTALVRLREGRFTRFTTEDGLAGNTIKALLEEPDGRLWIGTTEGLSLFRNEKFSSFSTKDGLPRHSVSSLFRDPMGTIWIGTSGVGLFKMQPREAPDLKHPKTNGVLNTFHISHFTAKDGLFSDTIFEVIEDDYGLLWMSCPKGIFRVLKKDFERFDRKELKQLPCAAFGKSDGMVSTECNGVAKPAAWKSHDGRLWFPTTKGLVVAEPNIQLNGLPPSVAIEEIMADRKRIQDSAMWKVEKENLPLLIPPGRGDLEFHYTALSFQMPEKNQFQYKLEGFDADWIDAGTRRIAYYNNLPPGKYEFKVKACNNDGFWNEAGSSVKLSLQPHFWQTSWFRLLAILSGLGATGGIVRYLSTRKLQHRLALAEQQHAIEKERRRIAQDMHDDLGSQLTEIQLLGELAVAKQNESEIKTQVNKMLDVSRQVVRNLDTIVWSVNPKNDTLENLANYIYEQAELFLGMRNIRCRLDVPDEMPPCPISSEVRHNLFLVMRESLNNIIKHSGATEVCLRLSFKDSLLSIGIEDNGKGFSQTNVSALGNGLQNMEKRMKNIGGRFELKSELGKGTRIAMQVPLHH